MRRILGVLLLVQVLVMVSLAVLAQVIFEGIGPDDDVVPQTDYEARARLAGVVIGVLVVLGSTALVYVVQWIRNLDVGPPWPLAVAHVGGAVTMGMFQRPLAVIALLVAAAAWWGLDSLVRSRSARQKTAAGNMVEAL